MSIVAKRLYGSRWHLTWRWALIQATLCYMGKHIPSPQSTSPIFSPFLLSTNGWMNQDATWYGGRPQPRRLCVRWGPSPRPKKGADPPKFSAHVYCGQTPGRIKMTLGMEVGHGPSHIVLVGDPAPLPPKGDKAPSAIFGPFFTARAMLSLQALY